MEDNDRHAVGRPGTGSPTGPGAEPSVPFGTARGVPAGYRPGSVAFGTDAPDAAPATGRARGRRRGPLRRCGR